jgi:DNA topoisomerase-2
MIGGEPMTEMTPWFRGFSRNSAIKKIGDNKYLIRGRYTADTNEDMLHITELPIGISSNSYKEFLATLLANSKPSGKTTGRGKGKGSLTRRSVSCQYKIRDFRNNSAGNKVDFKVFFEKDTLCQYILDAVDQDKDGVTDFERNMKLVTTLSFPGKLVLRDRNGGLYVYASIEDIFKDFFSLRMEYYEKRRKVLLKDYKEEADLVNIKAKFVQDVIEGRVIIFDSDKKKSYSKTDVSAQLEKLEYPKMVDKVLYALKEIKPADLDKADYEFLLGMKISALTREKVEELLAEMNELVNKYKTLKAKTAGDLWVEDLDNIEKQYHKDMKEFESELVKELEWGSVKKETKPKGKNKKN